jgi:phosphatidylserine decarboxylase
MKVAKGSTPWILSACIAGIIFLILTLISNWPIPQVIFLFFTVVIFLKTGILFLFFRDPKRDIGKGIVACADGRIREKSNFKDNDVGDCTKISTFMNLYNVHVNRMPLDGTLKNVAHISGIHLPAFRKESEKNERVITIIDTNIGTIKVVQIAGTLARRIVPYIKKGDKLKKGERIGMIRFGSRVDVYLPTKKIKNVHVKIGDMVKAGETTLAEIND